jgi:hypothetical protein
VASLVAGILLTAGISVWLAILGTTVYAAFFGTLAIAGAGLLFSSLLWNWPFRSLGTHVPAAEVGPPGGGIPYVPPVEYQVAALRQVIAKMTTIGVTQLGLWELEEFMKNFHRSGTDPVLEPLHGVSCQEGLARLVTEGLLSLDEKGNWAIARRS